MPKLAVSAKSAYGEYDVDIDAEAKSANGVYDAEIDWVAN